MRKIFLIGISVLAVGFVSGCELFDGRYDDVTSLNFNNEGVLLEVVPDHELRTLSVVFDANDSGMIGGDYFDRAEEILGVFTEMSVESSEGDFIFSIYKKGGEVNEFYFDLTDSSEEFALIESFYTDVSALFSEDVY